MPAIGSPAIDIVDSTWLSATPSRAAAAVSAGEWTQWWPGLDLVVAEDRGVRGIRWTVPCAADDLSGSAEVWLQPVLDGVVAHFFLRLDPPAGRVLTDRDRNRISRHYRELTKTAFWALGDSLDPGRARRMSASTAARATPSDETWQINW